MPEAEVPRASATASGRSVAGVIACIHGTCPGVRPSEDIAVRWSLKNPGPAISAE